MYPFPSSIPKRDRESAQASTSTFSVERPNGIPQFEGQGTPHPQAFSFPVGWFPSRHPETVQVWGAPGATGGTASSGCGVACLPATTCYYGTMSTPVYEYMETEMNRLDGPSIDELGQKVHLPGDQLQKTLDVGAFDRVTQGWFCPLRCFGIDLEEPTLKAMHENERQSELRELKFRSVPLSQVLERPVETLRTMVQSAEHSLLQPIHSRSPGRALRWTVVERMEGTGSPKQASLRDGILKLLWKMRLQHFVPSGEIRQYTGSNADLRSLCSAMNYALPGTTKYGHVWPAEFPPFHVVQLGVDRFLCEFHPGSSWHDNNKFFTKYIPSKGSREKLLLQASPCDKDKMDVEETGDDPVKDDDYLGKVRSLVEAGIGDVILGMVEDFAELVRLGKLQPDDPFLIRLRVAVSNFRRVRCEGLRQARYPPAILDLATSLLDCVDSWRHYDAVVASNFPEFPTSQTLRGWKESMGETDE